MGKLSRPKELDNVILFSPYLFILCAEGLSSLIQRVEQNSGKIENAYFQGHEGENLDRLIGGWKNLFHKPGKRFLLRRFFK
jgi:hypothetical protein